MSDIRNAGAKGTPGRQAVQAEGRLLRANHPAGSQEQRPLDPAILRSLSDAALAPQQDDRRHAVAAALANGISAEEIADLYIPAIAREMGDKWCVDQMSFASVTIGVSRLQGMLRDLGPQWAGDHLLDPTAPSVLLIVPENVHHTLGAIILSGQLRRRGISIKLMLGEPVTAIAAQLRRCRYAAVFISASQSESLESLRRIIDVVRSVAQAPLPVVVGGGILQKDTADTITELTGADHATGQTDEGLRLCGIKPPKHSSAAAVNGI